MQIWKACEIWSHAMMSVRQRVGNKESQALSHNVCPRTGARAIPQAASIPLIVCNAREGPMWNRNYYSWSQLPVCLPSSTCCCHTWLNTPGLSLHTCILQAFKWEQSYISSSHYSYSSLLHSVQLYLLFSTQCMHVFLSNVQNQLTSTISLNVALYLYRIAHIKII